jgi:glycosidase
MVKIFDSWDSSYKSKFGALKCGEPCRFSVRLPKEIKNDLPPIMVIFRVGFKERFLIMEEASSNDEYTVYSVEYTPTSAGIHYYYFTVVCSEKRGFIKRKGCNEGVFGDGGMFQLTVYDKDFATPSFLKGGIMYQIFPDRFCKSGKPHDNIPFDRIIHEDWYELPRYKPDESGAIRNNDYFGGDFEGIIQKLDYLKSLGVTCIYLNPIFEAHENHRYNTANYLKADPMLGTNEDFKRLCEKAHEAGIKVILDGVFSHTGADSIYFNKFGRYDSVGAYNSKESPYYSWYTFTNYPDSYECWWGFNTLPNVDENNESYTKYICGEGGVIDYWLSLGADGFRLDVVDELPDEFLDNLRIAVKRNGSEKIIIGEVWEDASNKISYGIRRRYLIGSQLDSTMNYPFRDAIIGYILGMDSKDFENRIMTILENYPKPTIDVLMNSLSTHDVERAINIFAVGSCEGKSRDWQAQRALSPEEYELGKKRLKCAMVLQFFLPGVPCVYYGDEAGLDGFKDPFNRKCYPWGREDRELIEFTKLLAKIRRRCCLFAEGELKFLFSDNEIIVFSRICKEKNSGAVIILNKSPNLRRIWRNSDIARKFEFYEIVRGKLDGDALEIPPYDFAVIMISKSCECGME